MSTKLDSQRTAEADVEELRRDGGAFVVAAEETRMPMVFTDAKTADQAIIYANDAFLSLSGYEREEVIGRNFNFLMPQRADAETIALVDAAFAGEGASAEVRFGERTAAHIGQGCSSVRFVTQAVQQFSFSPL